MSDQLDDDARQVRYDTPKNNDKAVHKMVANLFQHASGRVYRTKCGRTMTASEKAILTTREVSCTFCRGSNRPRTARAALDALLLEAANG